MGGFRRVWFDELAKGFGRLGAMLGFSFWMLGYCLDDE